MMKLKINNRTDSKPSGLVVSHFSFQVETPQQEAVNLTSATNKVTDNNGSTLRKRLYGPDPRVDELIWPIRKYWPGQSWDESWSLYWLPLSFSNRSDTQIDLRFAKFLQLLLPPFLNNPRLAKFTFFNSNFLHPHLVQHFVLHAVDYFPLPAIGFCPEEGACRLPQPDELAKIDPHETYQILQEKQQDLRMSDLFPNSPRMLQCIFGSQDLARDKLTGRGGYSFVVSKLNQTEFFARTKVMFARNTNDEAMLRIPMIAPVLSTTSFTRCLRSDCADWFSMFDLYINESPKDKGVVIAANQCLDEILPNLVEQSGLREIGRRSRFGLRLKEPKW